MSNTVSLKALQIITKDNLVVIRSENVKTKILSQQIKQAIYIIYIYKSI